jgi:hypothetical protein
VTETIELVIKIVPSVCTGIMAVLSLILAIKQGKYKNLFKGENAKHFVMDILREAMTVVENFANYTGEEKKEYVMTKVNQYCIENNIKYDAELTEENIEKMIDFSKGVNNGKSRANKL